MSKLFQELKRRKVFRVAAVYAVAAWLLIQVADVVLPTFGAPPWVNQTLIFLFVIGIIPTLIAAWAYEITPGGVKPDAQVQAAAGSPVTSAQPVNYVILLVVLAVAGIQVADRVGGGSTESTPAAAGTGMTTRLAVRMPADQNFHPSRGDFDIAPDGSFFVYRGSNETGQPQLWLRRFDSLSASPLGDTQDASRPKISPDGREVVFHSGSRIRLVQLQSGITRTLVQNRADGPNWSHDGEHVYYSIRNGGIGRVPKAGGESESITTVDTSRDEVEHLMVEALPDGSGIIFQVRTLTGSLIQYYDLESGAMKDLVPGRYPIYTESGHQVFQDADDPVHQAAAFDLRTRELSGEPTAVADNLYRVGTAGAANVAISGNGRLLYRSSADADYRTVPMWIDRQGSATVMEEGFSLRSGAGGDSHFAISPDGSRVAFDLASDQGNYNIWVKYLQGGPFTRVTFSGLANGRPQWDISGENLLFLSNRDGSDSIWSRRADGSGSASLVLSSSNISFASPTLDGSYLVYQRDQAIFAVNMDGEATPRPLVVNDFGNFTASVSPDGRWLSYISNESGQFEVYVRPFPDTESGRWQVSSEGGVSPVWANNGDELFYIDGRGDMIAVNIRPGDGFAWDSQEALFSANDYSYSAAPWPVFDSSPDDERFLMLSSDRDAELILVDNWQGALP